MKWAADGNAAPVLERFVEQYRSAQREHEESVPSELRDAFLTDLAVFLRDDLRMHSQFLGAGTELRAEVVAVARELLLRIGADDLRAFNKVPVAFQARMAWLGVVEAQHETPVSVASLTQDHKRTRLYVYSPERHLNLQPASSGDWRILAQKARSVEMFDAHWTYEHILIVDTQDLEQVRFTSLTPGISLMFDGAPVEHRRATALWQGRSQSVSPKTSDRATPLTRKEKLVQLRRRIPLGFMRLTRYTRRFDGAWVLADRKDQANDNAEVLFRYLREERKDINAWFVIDKQTSAYRELKQSGGKVIPFGSARHFGLMQRSKIFICSQSDTASTLPFGPRHITQTWLYAYLKHGVIHTDHYRRFNRKNIDIVATATRAEHDALSGDGGPYRLTQSETVLSGMPRHDRLFRALKEHRTSQNAERSVLLICPTWRIYLAEKNQDQTWSVGTDFQRTEFVREWSALLNDRSLRDLCNAHNLEPVFLMHPRFQRHAELFDAPEWVTMATYETDISKLIARTTIAITDYSSLAFEAAFVGAPTVYFQFDRDRFFSGGHSSQVGSYDYAEQGFGPVVVSENQVIAAVTEMLDPEASARYQRRITDLYAYTDDNACERLTHAIERRLS